MRNRDRTSEALRAAITDNVDAIFRFAARRCGENAAEAAVDMVSVVRGIRSAR